MSNRQTSDWTPDSAGAFGESGEIGDRGEFRAAAYLQETFPNADIEVVQDNRFEQVNNDTDIKMIVDDIMYRVQIKNNLHKSYPTYVVDANIMRSNADYWFHLNDSDPDDMRFYKTADMQKYITEHSPRFVPGSGYLIPNRVFNAGVSLV